MNERFVIDAYAWIEYLEGSKAGERVRKVIEENETYTSAVTLAEIVSKAARKGMDHIVAYQAITTNSVVIAADEELSREAGLLHAKQRKKTPDFSLADAYVLACVRKTGGKIITGDPHFKKLRGTVML